MNKEIKFTPKNYLDTHREIFNSLDLDKATECINAIKRKFDNQNQIFTCGNGGSAHTANHMITDWNKMINLATKKKFRGICLCDNIGLITAYANDISYDHVFAGQLEAMADDQDLVIAVSGSGNSPNVLKALETAKKLGCVSLGVLGYDGGKAKSLCDHSVVVPSFDMQLCEDVHLQFGHLVMKHLCGDDIVCD